GRGQVESAAAADDSSSLFEAAAMSPEAIVRQLSAWLERRLPLYMLPSALVLMDHFPLTPNGKLDRRALPEPEWGAGEICPPETPTQQMLSAIWCEVLGLAEVSVEASFFELGGHSLLATQLMSRVREAFRVEMPVRALFAAPTVGV